MTHAPPPHQPPDGFMRLPAVVALVGLQRSTIYALAQRGRFPAPEKLTLHASGWRARAVYEWLRDPSAWRAPGP